MISVAGAAGSECVAVLNVDKVLEWSVSTGNKNLEGSKRWAVSGVKIIDMNEKFRYLS